MPKKIVFLSLFCKFAINSFFLNFHDLRYLKQLHILLFLIIILPNLFYLSYIVKIKYENFVINNQKRNGRSRLFFFLIFTHISKKYKKPVSLLAKDNSRAKELLIDDSHINEIITLEKEMDGIFGILKLTKN